ncbi:MAG: hypothetical protein GMKNLPBB_01654 [Myxococcota bacterium]|nr:hypothetical protein [Myxococcota bacterium]
MLTVLLAGATAFDKGLAERREGGLFHMSRFPGRTLFWFGALALMLFTACEDSGLADATVRPRKGGDASITPGLNEPDLPGDPGPGDASIEDDGSGPAPPAEELDAGGEDDALFNPLRDASKPDTAETDTGAADTGPGDTEPADTGAGGADASSPDSGPPDVAPADTGSADTSLADAGIEDTGASDTAAADAGASDTGADASLPDSGTSDGADANPGADAASTDGSGADSGTADNGDGGVLPGTGDNNAVCGPTPATGCSDGLTCFVPWTGASKHYCKPACKVSTDCAAGSQCVKNVCLEEPRLTSKWKLGSVAVTAAQRKSDGSNWDASLADVSPDLKIILTIGGKEYPSSQNMNKHSTSWDFSKNGPFTAGQLVTARILLYDMDEWSANDIILDDTVDISPKWADHEWRITITTVGKYQNTPLGTVTFQLLPQP